MLSFKLFENINWSEIKKYGFDIFPKDVFIELEKLKKENLIIDWYFEESEEFIINDEDTVEPIILPKNKLLCIITKLTTFKKNCDLDELDSIYKLIDKIKNRINIDEDHFISLPEVQKFIDADFEVNFDKGYIIIKKKTYIFSFELTKKEKDLYLICKSSRSRHKEIKINSNPLKTIQYVLRDWLDKYDYLFEK